MQTLFPVSLHMKNKTNVFFIFLFQTSLLISYGKNTEVMIV